MLQNLPRYRVRQRVFWLDEYAASSWPSESTFGIYEPASSLTEHITLLHNLAKVDLLKQMSFAPVDGERAIVFAGRECAFASQARCVLGNPTLSQWIPFQGNSSTIQGASRYLTVSKIFYVKWTFREDPCRNLKRELDTYIKNRYIFVILELRDASLPLLAGICSKNWAQNWCDRKVLHGDLRSSKFRKSCRTDLEPG